MHKEEQLLVCVFGHTVYKDVILWHQQLKVFGDRADRKGFVCIEVKLVWIQIRMLKFLDIKCNHHDKYREN